MAGLLYIYVHVHVHCTYAIFEKKIFVMYMNTVHTHDIQKKKLRITMVEPREKMAYLVITIIPTFF